MEQDFVGAYVELSLAARAYSWDDSYRKLRDEAKAKLTPEQLREADQRVAAYKPRED